jgi:hypothetical protein
MIVSYAVVQSGDEVGVFAGSLPDGRGRPSLPLVRLTGVSSTLYTSPCNLIVHFATEPCTECQHSLRLALFMIECISSVWRRISITTSRATSTSWRGNRHALSVRHLHVTVPFNIASLA